MIGVNALTEGDGGGTEILRIDPDMERKQIELVKAFKAGRDAAAVEAALVAIREAATVDRNLMPLFLDAGRAGVSDGEIVQALQSVWGDYRELPVF